MIPNCEYRYCFHQVWHLVSWERVRGLEGEGSTPPVISSKNKWNTHPSCFPLLRLPPSPLLPFLPLSLSFPQFSLLLSLSPHFWALFGPTAPVCSLSHVIFLFRCRWIFVIIWNSLQYISHCPQNVYHPCRKWVTLLGKTPIFGISTESKHRFSSNIAHCTLPIPPECTLPKNQRKRGKMVPTSNGINPINFCLSEVILFSWGKKHIP